MISKIEREALHGFFTEEALHSGSPGYAADYARRMLKDFSVSELRKWIDSDGVQRQTFVTDLANTHHEWATASARERDTLASYWRSL